MPRPALAARLQAIARTAPRSGPSTSIPRHSKGPLTGSLYIGRTAARNSVPRLHDLRRLRHLREARRRTSNPDPETGQLTMSVTDLPQVPFEEFNLHLFASDRGLIATPTRCGIYTADSNFVPWNDQVPAAASQPLLNISSGPGATSAPARSAPSTHASPPVPPIRSQAPIELPPETGPRRRRPVPRRPRLHAATRLHRQPARHQATAPKRRSWRRRRNSVAASRPTRAVPAIVHRHHERHGRPRWPPVQRVGRMYLSGPFKGAPLSLAAVTPALAGPYDYGVVVVRVALHVDPLDAHVFAASDKVPSIIGGIPIRMRSIQVNIDKPNFTINPTNCDPFAVARHGIGDQGTRPTSPRPSRRSTARRCRSSRR